MKPGSAFLPLFMRNAVPLYGPGRHGLPADDRLASTFQPDLAREMTETIRRQMRSSARIRAGAVLDVARDPRWGRLEETFGEDPTLVSQFGMAYVRGLQGKSLKRAG